MHRRLYKYQVITFDNKTQISGLFTRLFINLNLHMQILLESTNQISHWKYQTKTKTKTKTAILKL